MLSSWPPLTGSAFLCLLGGVFILAWLTQIKILDKKRWEFTVSHGLAFLSSLFRVVHELKISLYY